MKIGRITISDRASKGVYVDRSGPEIERVLRKHWHSKKLEFCVRLIPDNQKRIQAVLVELADREQCRLIVTTGGTGPSPRDVTPEATRAVVEKELPGFGEIMRARSFAKTPTAILSRATAGIRGQSLILNLPGNPASIIDCLPPLIPAIRDALNHLFTGRRRGNFPVNKCSHGFVKMPPMPRH